jgi:uncharacterized membrane protein YbhN (UPF0104 family)
MAEKLSGFVQRTRAQVLFFRRSRVILSAAYLISIGFYLVTCVTAWAAVSSTGAQVDFGYVLSIVPFILLAALIPISVNGLGITESGYVLFLHSASMSMLDAVTIALLIRARVLFTAILGGLTFLLYKPALASIPDPDALLSAMDTPPSNGTPDTPGRRN